MTIKATVVISRLGRITCKELITNLKTADDVSTFTLNDLKTEFFNRFKQKLYRYCDSLCRLHRCEEDVAKDIFQETIIKSFEKIIMFDFELQLSDERLINKIIGWLNKIAHNLFIDYLKVRSKTLELDDSYEDACIEEDLPNEIYFDENVNVSLLLQQGMDELNSRERMIVLLCIEHNCLDNKRHLPDSVIQTLCSDLSIKKGNIRIIKYRALQKIRSKFPK